MRILVLLVLIPLAGCALFESKAERAQRNSPDYKAGYTDGCATASAQNGANPRESGMMRDEDAFRSNDAYRAGWRTGYNGCRLYLPQTGAPGMPGGGPLP